MLTQTGMGYCTVSLGCGGGKVLENDCVIC